MLPNIRLLFLLLMIPGTLFSQQNELPQKKTYTATRIDQKPVIDGVLDDAIWNNIPMATNFVMYEPGDGSPSRNTHTTDVKIAYTDEAIYLAAYLYDEEPSNIRREFAQRDNLPTADYFFFDLNTYNDGENQTRFYVTAAGTLADAKMKRENEDFAFNVVWEARVSMDEKGWYVEMEIPYSALRFPNSKEQLWSMQLGRHISFLNETYVWNYINKSLGASTHYNGLLKGVQDIDAPVRLSFYPYVSGEVNYYKDETTTAFNAGMDFKYGINDAFTLDATLIPDFGQTAYDEVELNLGPFEQTFGENRAFFTEGTELFTKGDLFYSRRIGDTPIGFNQAQDARLENEDIVDNPETTNLLNALKISGRTENGLGIGFFNAITEKQTARYYNKLTEESRELITEPLANYNIFVLDQQFDQKSSVSLINTNVTREGHFRDGNVTGFLFDVYNASSSFNFSGEAKMSRVNYPNSNKTGFASKLGFSRTKGKFRYGVSHDFANKTYDINDLGLNFINNYNNFLWETSYRIFEPQGIFNRFNISLFGDHQRRYDPDVAVTTSFGSSFFGMTRDRFAFGGSAGYSTPFKDFFEPRRDDYFIEYPENTSAEVWISSDYRRRIALDSRLGYNKYLGTDHGKLNFSFSPRFRVSNKFLLIYSFEYREENDRESFVTLLPKNVIFGTRDMRSIENSLQGSYNFNTREALSLSFRNFWSSADFARNDFSRLLNNGSLVAYDYDVNEENDPNANFNIWNLDLSYQWRFAPGSELILLYRNSIFKIDKLSELNYTESLDNLFSQPARHNLSLRIVYYLDYNTIKNTI
ncbi:DUF5916 domain-containing protein [Salinimicrobium sediminilitoris]|uniref:DUF5916 domain-containing protein n=1 Tax=Salinimicrobium sediminilitoris TaxID=2876715 RepID=UPI001E4899B4|nr:DUF5916 domain-containing protein [Salinimicrobium sediminilitoris]MCC8358616.1 carbohydrate binding family 9 domain-containing protein [Salinimicrobium sediminilitoris]